MANRKAINYETARGILLTVGLLVLGVVVLVMFGRRVDPTEVVATLMFLPIFLTFMVWGTRGGLLMALVASAAYVTLRYPAIQAVGLSRFTGLIITRTLGYLGFGAAGGWAAEQLKANLIKLDLYDTIDDATGLHNSRSVVDTIDLEQSRSQRYEKIFSVVTLETTVPELPKRKLANLLKQLGSTIAAGARTVDHTAHAYDGDHHIFVIILPETGQAGAQTFLGKLRHVFADALAEHGVSAESLHATTSTFPDQPAEVDALVERFKDIEHHDFPETS